MRNIPHLDDRQMRDRDADFSFRFHGYVAVEGSRMTWSTRN
jgi:hypothetical protein